MSSWTTEFTREDAPCHTKSRYEICHVAIGELLVVVFDAQQPDL